MAASASAAATLAPASTFALLGSVPLADLDSRVGELESDEVDCVLENNEVTLADGVSCASNVALSACARHGDWAARLGDTSAPVASRSATVENDLRLACAACERRADKGIVGVVGG